MEGVIRKQIIKYLSIASGPGCSWTSAVAELEGHIVDCPMKVVGYAPFNPEGAFSVPTRVSWMATFLFALLGQRDVTLVDWTFQPMICMSMLKNV